MILHKINRKQTFDNYRENEGNRFARRAALSVALKPNLITFNPFIVYGTKEVGKTHLLNAIANKANLLFPEKIIISSIDIQKNYPELFSIDTNNRNKEGDSVFFKPIMSVADILILDDVDLLLENENFREFFHSTINNLNKKVQIIGSMTTAPTNIKGLHTELIAFFEKGFLAEITKVGAYVDYLKTEIDFAGKIKKAKKEFEGTMFDFFSRPKLKRESKSFIEKVLTDTQQEVFYLLYGIEMNRKYSLEEIAIRFDSKLEDVRLIAFSAIRDFIHNNSIPDFVEFLKSNNMSFDFSLIKLTQILEKIDANPDIGQFNPKELKEIFALPQDISKLLEDEIEWSFSTLTNIEGDILRLFFAVNTTIGNDCALSLEEIGAKFDLTTERIRQIKEKGIRRLRHTSRSKLLRVLFQSADSLTKSEINLAAGIMGNDFLDKIKESLPTKVQSENSISIYFDLDEFSEEEIANVIFTINKLYQSIGGDEIIIKGQTLLTTKQIVEPVYI